MTNEAAPGPPAPVSGREVTEPMTPTIEEIQKLVALQLGKRRVAAGDRLVEDLGAESIDLVSLVATLEDRYGVTVADEELAALRTVADVHALARRHTGRPG